MSNHDDYLFHDKRRSVWLPALRALLRATLDDAWSRAPEPPAEPYFVIKEPSGSEVADQLWAVTPEASLVFLMRDPRDVITSWLYAYEPDGWIQAEGGFVLDDETRSAFVRWQAAVWEARVERVQGLYDGLPASRRLYVTYEELRDQPVVALLRLHAIFQEHSCLTPEALAEVVKRIVERHSYGAVPASARGPLKHIRAAEPGNWRSHLRPEDVRIITSMLGPLMDRYGYR